MRINSNLIFMHNKQFIFICLVNIKRSVAILTSFSKPKSICQHIRDIYFLIYKCIYDF